MLVQEFCEFEMVPEVLSPNDQFTSSLDAKRQAGSKAIHKVRELPKFHASYPIELTFNSVSWSKLERSVTFDGLA